MCSREQEELIEISGGACGQIVCFHLEEEQEAATQSLEEEETKEIGKIIEEKPEEMKAKKRKNNENSGVQHGTGNKKTKKQNEKENGCHDDMIFPTIAVMNAAKITSLTELPTNTVYEIMNATKRIEKFKGKDIDYVVLTLRKKNDTITQVIRASGILFMTLFHDEKYEERSKTHRFFFLYKGWNQSKERNNKYHDFILKTIMK